MLLVTRPLRAILIVIFLIPMLIGTVLQAPAQSLKWADDGNSYYRVEDGQIFLYTLPANEKKVLVTKQQLTPAGGNSLKLDLFTFSPDKSKLLVYTNSQKVWRLKTRGDYYVLDLASGKLTQLGKGLPAASMMFAKFSPDGSRVAYVSNYNLFVEDLNGQITQLTKDGSRKFINATFDWVYEEEFSCRDGFRWSNDSKSIAYWQVDARATRDHYMINNTDSVYSRVIPVEYPKVGQDPSAVRIGVVDISSGATKWMQIDGDPRQNYLVRLEFIPGTNDFIVQQLNRKQNESRLIRCNAATGASTKIYEEKDNAWVDVSSPDNAYTVDFRHTIYWLAGGKEFLWPSEKDGWRHIYRVSVDGKKDQLITPGAYDVIQEKVADEKSGYLYFIASPENATQKYLYRIKMDGKGKPERVTPALDGTHAYNISPNAKFASHVFSNHYTRPVNELIALPAHKPLNEAQSIQSKLSQAQEEKVTEFFKITTEEGVEMDGWMVKPANFDPAKKYPVVFYVYTEPAGANVTDSYGSSQNFMYTGDMRQDGYIYMSIDNRGTPAPKGANWRKCIYRKVGLLNIRDQALAAKEVMKWPFVDSDRTAVWGWSGGGSATLNLMFQFPDIYKTGIAVAAVANELTYDNIYQERYMGLPQENMQDFVAGSPITYAKNLKGNLLYIHGTGDDNVHYANAEMLVNELIRNNKQFQFMPYPNRTHGISEGAGTFEHLSTLYTNYLRANCPPGGR
jgi:dipeptidyl-peptidase-4